MTKIFGNTTVTPSPHPDWNQDNPNKADYIKNKPTILLESKNLFDYGELYFRNARIDVETNKVVWDEGSASVIISCQQWARYIIKHTLDNIDIFRACHIYTYIPSDEGFSVEAFNVTCADSSYERSLELSIGRMSGYIVIQFPLERYDEFIRSLVVERKGLGLEVRADGIYLVDSIYGNSSLLYYGDENGWTSYTDLAGSAECDRHGNIIDETYAKIDKIQGDDSPKQIIKFDNGLSIESREDGIYLVDTNQEDEEGRHPTVRLYDGGTNSFAENASHADYASEAGYASDADYASLAVWAECDADGNYISETYATKAEVGVGARKVIQFDNGFSIESREAGLYLVVESRGGNKEWCLQDESGAVLATLAENAQHAFYAEETGIADCAVADTQGRMLKGTEIVDYGDMDAVDISLADGYVLSFGIVSESLFVNTDGDWLPGELTMSLEFTTPSEMPEDYSQIKNVYFKGDSTEDEGYFVPEPNTRYTIVFSFNGDMVVGYVSGVPAPSVREVTE